MRSGWDAISRNSATRKMTGRYDRLAARRIALSGGLFLVLFLILSAGWNTAILALDPSRSLAQFGHDIWQRDQGLPHNTIHSILQTRDGFLWLATEEGLARFDGVRFRSLPIDDEAKGPALFAAVARKGVGSI